MRLSRKVLAIISLFVLLTTSDLWSKDEISLTHMVDLTHTLSGKFPIVPVPGLTFPFDQKPIASLEKNGVFAEEWHMIAHNGTHMDAPIHYIEGGQKAINDPKTFVGLDSKGETHFPTLSPEAIDFLLKERNISGVGVDTLSFDQVEHTQKAAAHKVLFKANRWGIECINNLGKIPPKGASIFAGALKVEGASASPIRLIAVW
jgi:kynurenine formamidase